jgi:hypothetical protein
MGRPNPEEGVMTTPNLSELSHDELVALDQAVHAEFRRRWLSQPRINVVRASDIDIGVEEP